MTRQGESPPSFEAGKAFFVSFNLGKSHALNVLFRQSIECGIIVGNATVKMQLDSNWPHTMADDKSHFCPSTQKHKLVMHEDDDCCCCCCCSCALIANFECTLAETRATQSTSTENHSKSVIFCRLPTPTVGFRLFLMTNRGR